MSDAMDAANADLNVSRTYYDQAIQLPPNFTTNIFTGTVTTNVTSVNGASGPSITLATSISGLTFATSGSTVTLDVTSAANVRTAITAAKSGTNADITSFTGLAGNTGFNAWTGTPNQATHATYPTTTASAGYVQVEVQGLMDSMKQATELIMALLTALLASGVIET